MIDDVVDEVARNETAVEGGIDPDQAAIPVVGAEVNRAAAGPGAARSPGDEYLELVAKVLLVQPVVDHLEVKEIPLVVDGDASACWIDLARPVQTRLAVEPDDLPPEIRLGCLDEPRQGAQDTVGGFEEHAMQGNSHGVAAVLPGEHD